MTDHPQETDEPRNCGNCGDLTEWHQIDGGPPGRCLRHHCRCSAWVSPAAWLVDAIKEAERIGMAYYDAQETILIALPILRAGIESDLRKQLAAEIEHARNEEQ